MPNREEFMGLPAISRDFRNSLRQRPIENARLPWGKRAF
jgi:hypothetical protein